MNTDYILIVLGEPYSVFSEIIGKYFRNKKKFKKKIIIIGNQNLLTKQLKKLNCNFPINSISNYKDAEKKKINLINIKFKHKKIFDKISNKSNLYIRNCFKKSLEIIGNKEDKFVLINGPVSKKTFLKKQYSGITEYLSQKTHSTNEVMLIYNNKFSVSPITTHIPIKKVVRNITKDKIQNKVIRLNNFYKKVFKKKIAIAVLGLNPHCETIDKFSEEEKIIYPAIKYLKNAGIRIFGPFSADTFFIKKNINKYDLVIGMYHDQVLTPMKTIFNFDAINITVGLPFIRISPDHGPNSDMLGKNLSDPSSFIYAMKFAENIR